jgi:hypothetical protein
MDFNLSPDQIAWANSASAALAQAILGDTDVPVLSLTPYGMHA